MAVHAIEWRINQRLLRMDRMNWDQGMCKGFCMIFMLIFTKFIFMACFGPYTFIVG